MSNLDKVLQIWTSLEDNYLRKNEGTRKEFLMKLAGSEAVILKLRKMVMKDFVDSEENTDRLNMLFSVIDSVHEKLSTVDEIDNLDVFVWGDTKLEEHDYQFLRDTSPTFADLAKAIAEHKYASEFYGDRELRLPTEAVGFLHFELSDTLIRWLSLHDANEMSGFFRSAYAVLIRMIALKETEFPITVIDENLAQFNKKPEKQVKESKSYPQLGTAERFDCELKADFYHDRKSERNELVVVISQ